LVCKQCFDSAFVDLPQPQTNGGYREEQGQLKTSRKQ
jgi:hypothetical protein